MCPPYTCVPPPVTTTTTTVAPVTTTSTKAPVTTTSTKVPVTTPITPKRKTTPVPTTRMPDIIPERCDPARPHVAHPTDCYIFYHCVDRLNGVEMVKKTCNPPTMFNPVTMVCDWADSVMKIRPECSPSTLAPTTTVKVTKTTTKALITTTRVPLPSTQEVFITTTAGPEPGMTIIFIMVLTKWY